jgi:4,5-DOPA dioxygenase extradiol
MKKTKTRVVYLSHGGGPLPLLGDEGHREMVENLGLLARKIQKPSAIILISAHWEEQIPTITSAAQPSLIYDYYGFPEESYSIEYPCSGEPALAEQIHGLLNESGIESRLSTQRGFDHGLFVPLKIMYPEADIPCVQLSLVQGLNPEKHLEIGKALANGIDDDVLVIGSGFSFHNMQEFFAPITAESIKMNGAFQQWLVETFVDELDGEVRTERLKNWQDAPFARYCHPREEHLLPLHVCYGIAQSGCREYFQPTILNKKSSTFLW